MRGPARTAAFGAVAPLAMALAMACAGAASAAPSAAAPPRVLRFSGYAWSVVSSAEPRGPGPNRFDPRNAYIDADGRLVLETAFRDGEWTSAHLFLKRSLGYGRYRLVLAPMDRPLDPATVFGFFTWDDDPAFANREIDVELARWAIPSAPNLNFAVQPAEGRPDRSGLYRLDCSARTTLAFDWGPEAVRFTAENESGCYVWEFPAGDDPEPFGAPPAGRERVGLNLWLFRGLPPASADRVVIERFDFERQKR
ncbi:MAG: glycoside hydrolase family 16 protein [Spirochaetaceae bacterium]|nr:glycoside hydrolase family 16 protein [Spirochaetaceae bacterium]